MCVVCVKHTPNQERAVSWATWLKTEFRGHLAHLQPPTFCGFQLSEAPNETRRPVYGCTSAHLVEPRGSAARARWGPTVGPTGSPGRKKNVFSKIVPRPIGVLKQLFLARFEPVVMRFGLWKILKCPENGSF